MPIKFNIPPFLFRQGKSTGLPSHLPRLVLSQQMQPNYVRHCLVTQRLMKQLVLLDWELLPTTLSKRRIHDSTTPLCAYIGSYLVKIEYGIKSFGHLHRFLREHPALIWALGFPLIPDRKRRFGFDIEKSLPIQSHFCRKLRRLPSPLISDLLTGQVTWLQRRLGSRFGETVSIDTKHILAWVKENNPKEFVEGSHKKKNQPKGDPDCKLGCKRQSNQQTPASEGSKANHQVGSGTFYWGYASGAVVTKVPKVGEFVLAELTRTFDHGDATYFLPLMEQVESRLGFRPTYGAADAAFDNFYTHDYFYNEETGGFAAIPLRQMKHFKHFDEKGILLCEAGIPMTFKNSFVSRTSYVHHRKNRYICPLLFPEKVANSCPVGHKKWDEGGCISTIPSGNGSRIRYQLDRESDEYKKVYDQRTAVERIFSQAVALGIERPKLRNQQAIANYNTLIYIVINLRAMAHMVEQEMAK